jgi:enamine deaminase RidA (YjgF/YER057c/UK114 family)
VRTGNLLYLSGKGPDLVGGRQWKGKLGAEYTTEEGYTAARDTMLNLLAVIHEDVGDLSKVSRIVKVLGMVNSTPDFVDQPRVINGASDLLVRVFGDRGRHARSAVGMTALPGGIPVEIEMIVELGD